MQHLLKFIPINQFFTLFKDFTQIGNLLRLIDNRAITGNKFINIINKQRVITHFLSFISILTLYLQGKYLFYERF